MTPRRRIIESGLRSVAEGRISVEQVLENAALSPAFRRWLEAEAAKRREPRSIAIETRASFHPDAIRRAIATAKRLFRRHGVVDVGWGTRERRGVNHGHPVLILVVSRKIPLARLPRSNRLPTNLEIRFKNRRIKIPIDVQELAHGRKHGMPVRPGDLSLVIIGTEMGTISAVVESANRTSVIVSGHVAKPGASAVARLGNGSEVPIGKVQFVQNDSVVDGARVEGIDKSDVPLLASQPTEVRELGPNDLNIVVTVHRAQGNGDIDASIDGIGLPAEFDNDDGTTSSMTGLVKLHKTVTHAGDSGAPVRDSNQLLVGFVIGSAAGHTYVIPARRVLDAMA